MKSDVIFLLVLPAFFILIDYINGYFLIEKIRADYSALWVELDQPSLDASNYASSRLKLASFIWKRKFLSINDASLTAHCVIAILMQLALAACLLYGIWLTVR